MEDRKQFVGGFRLTAYDGARVDEDDVIHFAEGDAKVELLNDMRYLAYGNLPKTREEALENSDVPPGFSFLPPSPRRGHGRQGELATSPLCAPAGTANARRASAASGSGAGMQGAKPLA